MARRAMAFFLTMCMLLLGWAAMAMGEKLEGHILRQEEACQEARDIGKNGPYPM